MVLFGSALGLAGQVMVMGGRSLMFAGRWIESPDWMFEGHIWRIGMRWAERGIADEEG